VVRSALDIGVLKKVYDRVARRYDFQHGLLTARSDQRGRRLVVEGAVTAGQRILDCGSGTGSTALLAADKAGPAGRVVLFDLSENMLEVARDRARRSGTLERLEFLTGDMLHLPFDDGVFDVVLSTYSACPLFDPVKGALEMYRVLKPAGRMGVAHSTEPRRAAARWLADRVENLVWHVPSLSLGCRSVSVLPALEAAGCRVLLTRQFGIPLWPFLAFVVEKPAA
jgi:ubiquinone/menaquinone biosynthesis C-methylase UbiE